MAIEDYLQPGERIVATCGAVYATDKRLIHYTPRSKSMTFREYAYPRITALKLVPKARFSTVVLGFIVAMLSFLAGPGSPFQIGVAALGVGAMGMGFLLGDRYLEVAGGTDVENPVQWRLRDASNKDSREFVNAVRSTMASPAVYVETAQVASPATTTPVVVPRSMLLVAADQPSQVRTALESVAEVVCLDMTDLVHPANRETARLMVWGEIAAAARSSKGVWAHIATQEDLDACVWPGLSAVVATVDSAEGIRELEDGLVELEQERDFKQPEQVRIVVALDTADAVWAVREILAASPRVLAVVVGAHDLLSLPESASLRQIFSAQEYMQGRIAAGATEAGVPMLGMIGTSIAPGHLAEVLGPDIDERLAQAALMARDDGFQGAVTTHVEVAVQSNAAFPGYRPPPPVFSPLPIPPPLPAAWQPVVPSHFERVQHAPPAMPVPWHLVVPSHFGVKPQTPPPLPAKGQPVVSSRARLKSQAPPASPVQWQPVVPSHFQRVVPRLTRPRRFAMTVVRRSMLFTPANVRRFVEGVWKHSPDMVVLDLEDSVAPDEKGAARAMVREAIQLAGRGGAEVAVRVNSDTVTEDCNAAIWPGLCAVVLPKAESVEQIVALDALLTRLEPERDLPSGSVEIMPMIESAIGVENAYAIASASGRIKSFGVLGEADLTADLGASFDALQFHDVLAYPRGEVGLVARALGLTVNGRTWTPGKASIADYGDLDALEWSMRASWLAGCRSSFCIHPRQLAAANQHLRPSESDVVEAVEALRVYTDASSLLYAYGVHNGHIVDARVAHAAQEVIDYATVCDAKDAAVARRVAELEAEGRDGSV